MQKYELLFNTLFIPSLSHHDGHPAALLPFKLKKMVKDKNQIYYYRIIYIYIIIEHSFESLTQADIYIYIYIYNYI